MISFSVCEDSLLSLVTPMCQRDICLAQRQSARAVLTNMHLHVKRTLLSEWQSSPSLQAQYGKRLSVHSRQLCCNASGCPPRVDLAPAN